MSDEYRGALPGGRGLFALVFVHAFVEFAAWVAVLVVAFDEGGASATGLAVTAQLLPAALLAPLVSAAGDRFARDRVIAVAFTVQAIAAASITIALIASAPLAVVYVFAAVFTVASTASPATVASLLVHHARTPSQLMGWNITRSAVRAAGSLTGPLLVAIGLAIGTPSEIFGGLAAACGLAALLAGLRLPRDDRMPSTLSISTVLDDSWKGVTYVATTRAPRQIVGFIGASELLVGALDVVFVAVAYDQLGRGGSATALITVAYATGTLIAAAVTSRRRSWRITRLITLGSLMLSLPLLAMGETSLLIAVLALSAVLGAGNGMIEIGTQTLLQRSCTETMTSRAYGALDSTALAAAALGAALTGAVIDGDLTVTLISIGLIGAVVLLGGSIRLRSTERSIRSADPELVVALRSVSFLSSLPQPTLEHLARTSERRVVPAGVGIVIEGEPGDEFFLLRSGAVDISIGARVINQLSAPASFGEIALLRDVVRTATVTTAQASELVVIGQDEFLDAVCRTATSNRGALEVSDQYWQPSNPP